MKKLTFIVLVVAVLLFSGFILNQYLAKGATLQPDKSIFKDTMMEMSWPEVQKAAKTGAVVIFPIAVVEEHGPHMDLCPDIYLTCIVCRYIKQNLAKQGIQAIIAPPYYWGINQSTRDFPGSFTVRADTMKAVLSDTIDCFKTWGFKKIFCINLHGDGLHDIVLNSSIKEIRDSSNVDVFNLVLTVPPEKSQPIRTGKYQPDYHAGADETAMIWALYPDKVNEKLALKLKPQFTFNPLGYVGDPASFKLEKKPVENLKALAEYGAQLIEIFRKPSQKEQ